MPHHGSPRARAARRLLFLPLLALAPVSTTLGASGGLPQIEFALASSSATESGGPVQVELVLSAVSATDVTVPIVVGATSTALVPEDASLVQPVTILAGDLTGSVTVTPVVDGLFEGDESLLLELGTPTGADVGAVASHALTIVDDDPQPTVEFALASSSSSEAGGPVQVELLLSGASATDVTVPIVVGAASTALVPDDASLVQPVTIPAGDLTGSVTVTPLDDGLDEADETLVLEIDAPSGADVGAQAGHVLTLLDDDPLPVVRFEQRRQQTFEGIGTHPVQLSLSEPSGRDVTLDFAYAGSALAGIDFQAPAQLVVPAGQDSFTLDLELVPDAEVEGAELIVVALTGSPEAELHPSDWRAGVQVLDDDTPGWNPPTRGLRVDQQQLAFPATRAGESSPELVLVVRNQNTVPVTFKRFSRHGEDGEEFSVTYDVPVPVLLPPGGTVEALVRFEPTAAGPKDAFLRVQQDPPGIPRSEVALEARALGAPGEELLLNAALVPYVDSEFDLWLPDYGTTGTSLTVGTPAAVQGTADPTLYKSARIGAAFGYAVEVPDGTYELTLRFAELQHSSPGQRVFDVLVEGQPAVTALDLVAEVGGLTAHDVTVTTTVSDGILDLEFLGTTGQATVSAWALRSMPILDITPLAIDFETVEQGTFDQLDFLVTNTGLADGVVDTVGLLVEIGSAEDLRVDVAGQTFFGADISINFPASVVIPAGGQVPFTVTFEPTVHAEHQCKLRLSGEFGVLEGDILATGGANAGWGFLHPELFAEPQLVVDYDEDGSEWVTLLGGSSHTHEQGRSIVGHQWSSSTGGGPMTPFSTDPDTGILASQGDTTLELEITDDSFPVAQTASDTLLITVHPADAVPGLLTRYYTSGVGASASLLDAVPARPDFVERRQSTTLYAVEGRVGGSPYTGDVMVTWSGEFEVAAAAQYEFTVAGGVDSRLFVDGQTLNGAGTLVTALDAGLHALEVRFAVDFLTDLPLSLSVAVDGIPAGGFGQAVTYDSRSLLPVVHDMEDEGSELGGNLVTIEGFGFYPRDQVVVHWGDLIDFSDGDPQHDFLSITDQRIQLYTPSGPDALGGPSVGIVNVTVQTPGGTTLPRAFQYTGDGPVPIQFTYDDSKKVILPDPTCLAWGPDGRLYVATIAGTLHAITYDDDNRPTAVQTFTGVSGLVNNDVAGIAFNPYDPPSPVKVYLAHSQHYEFGGVPPISPSTYSGQVSVLTGPDFDAPVPLITGLPVSNHDHGINGILFDNDGNLLICSGGTTNAGVEHESFGGIPESPFSAALLRAFTSKPDFNGAIEYVLRDDPLTFENDQRFGEDVVPAPGVDVEVYVPGLRNAYDVALSSRGYLYATDNGPNRFGDGFGVASTGPDTDTGIHPDSDFDEILLLEYGNYYGHPNRSRGPDDPRQYLFHDLQAPSIPGVFTQKIGQYRSSTDGIVEYRATTFAGAMRGNLVLQRFGQRMVRAVLSPDGRSVEQVLEDLPYLAGLDVTTGPGGSLFSCSYNLNRVRMLEPNDVAAVGVTAYDIHPWRATSVGGQPFVIGGSGFGTLQDTTVRIGGIQAQLTSVSATRIRGLLPANPAFQPGEVDVEVQVGPNTSVMAGAFRWLPPTPATQPGFWTTGSDMTDPLGEVACAVVDGILYVWGEGSGKTYAYDIASDQWSDDRALRPFPGNHHGCEVIDGLVYLVGGLGSGGGKVQVYDPQLDSWSTGADMPWTGGSVSTCVIAGKIYAAGGIVGSSTVRNTAVYDPQLDAWTSLALMPNATKVNHAAAATDGQRFWIFGGRGGGNVPQPGYDVVQVYDPLTDTWETSDDPGTELVDMPGGRGGTGRAVLYQGEFLVFGGETNSSDPDPDATVLNVFPQVFAYDPVDHTWRQETDMPTPRHGIFPVLFQNRIFVVGGGTKNGFSSSAVLEIFQR